MAYMKVFFVFAMAMALSITITMKTTTHRVENEKPPAVLDNRDGGPASVPAKDDEKLVLPSKRVSRFLATDNPRAADHCNKDNEICYILGGVNYKCCNNKCYDLSTDKHNCGTCKNKCKYTQSCCRGQCVNLSYDKRHCGKCNNPCPKGEYCIYGMCNYA